MIERGWERKNYYELLGVARTATREEIKRAYREIASVYHPDSRFFDEIVREQLNDKHATIFKQITAAYHTLVNNESRKEYDDALPPDLPGWKRANEGDPLFESKLSATILEASEGKRPPATFGRFGRVETPSAFEPEIANELHTVAEMKTVRFKLRMLWKMAATVVRGVLRGLSLALVSPFVAASGGMMGVTRRTRRTRREGSVEGVLRERGGRRWFEFRIFPFASFALLNANRAHLTTSASWSSCELCTMLQR